MPSKISYRDLVALALFPDGSPLSSRLKNAALLQDLFKPDPSVHERAVECAGQLNQHLPGWLKQQLHLLHHGRPPWLPRFASQSSALIAEKAWQSRVTKQLESFLYEGLEALVGFRGELTVELAGFVPMKRSSGNDSSISTKIFLEDASGIQQGQAVARGEFTGGGADSPVLEATSEDSVLRLQVYSSDPTGRSMKQLVGEVKVALSSLPRDGSRVDLGLPLFISSSYKQDQPPPVYKVHRDPPIVNDLHHMKTGTLQCSLAFLTDMPGTHPDKAPSFGSEYLQPSPAVGGMGRADNLVPATGPQSPYQEVVDSLEKSLVFGSNNVEEVFLMLMDEMWEAWFKYTNAGKSWDHEDAARTRSLGSLPTMINASLGGIDVQRQPLYLILPNFDRQLDALMKDTRMANEHVPGMPFFHVLFVYAMMKGISPWLMKLAMCKHVLQLLLERKQQADTPLLQFLMHAIKEASIARKQQLLTRKEDELYREVHRDWDKCTAMLMKEHYDMIPPQDAFARRLLLQAGQRHTNDLQADLLQVAKKRMVLHNCDIHTVENALDRAKNATAYENLLKCVEPLGNAWTQAARDFEASLGLKLEAKDLLRGWKIEELLVWHYKNLCQVTCALMNGCPFWPYDFDVGYRLEDMQRLQDGLEAVNVVLCNHGLAAKSKKKSPQDQYDSAAGWAPFGASPARKGLKLPREVQPVYTYKVKTFTGHASSAGTESQVFIDIHGDVKSSGRITLSKDKLEKRSGAKPFQAGSVDEFRITVRGQLGSLSQVAVSTDGQGTGHSWYLERMEITDMGSRQVWYYDCQAWLSKTRADGKLERSFNGSLEAPDKRQTVYNVEVKTADIKDAGTVDRVYITMHGSIGEPHSEWLLPKLKTEFERGRHAHFSIRCSDLGNLKKIKLGIKPQGSGGDFGPDKNAKIEYDDWYVDYVLVTNTRNKAKWLFRVADRFDHVVSSREIYPINEEDLFEYQVLVTTANDHKAGLAKNCSVFLVLEGDQGRSGYMVLEDQCAADGQQRNRQPFQRGQTDAFVVYWKDLGQLMGMQIGHGGKSIRSKLGLSAGIDWLVEKVTVIDVQRSQQYTFKCGFKVTGAELDRKLQRPIVESVQVRKVVTYQVTTYTSNIWRAGTDAHVFIEIFGENNISSQEQQLLNKAKLNLFEAGCVDRFTISCPDLGTLSKVVIWHDNSGAGASWHLDRVEILDTRANQQYVFPCNAWLSDKQGDGGCQRTLTPLQPNAAGRAGSVARGQFAPAPELELLDWVQLMRPRVEKQISMSSNVTPAIIDRKIEIAEHMGWQRVSERYRYAKNGSSLTLDVTTLISQLSRSVVQNISHRRLRCDVACIILLYAVQPAGMKVTDYLQQECLKELHQLKLPRGPDTERGTFFNQDAEQLRPLCLRINTLLHHSTSVTAQLKQFEAAADSSVGALGGVGMTPADRSVLRQTYARVERSLSSKAGSMLAELRAAMRFSFAVLIESFFQQHDEDLRLSDFLREKMKELKDEWLLQECHLLYNLFWSSILEAVQCLLLGLAVWTLPSEMKLTTEQAMHLEAVLKTLEADFIMDELPGGQHWRPAHSLVDTSRPSYMGKLLSAGREDYKDMYNSLLETSREELQRLNERDAEPRLPYFATEVVSHMDHVADLQRSSSAELAVLDWVRLLRSADPQRGRRYKAQAEMHVEGLHQNRHMQVLFGLPFSEECTFTHPVTLMHQHPDASKTNRQNVCVVGQLYVFTTYVAFTTLVQLTPAGRNQDLMSETTAAPFRPLLTSDLTALWNATEDILHTELVPGQMKGSWKMMMTLSDHSVLELWEADQSGVEAVRECYRKVCVAMGLGQESLAERASLARSSAMGHLRGTSW